MVARMNDIKFEMDELIDPNSQEQFLIAPFNIETQIYNCECASCSANMKYYTLIPKLFCIGLFFTPCQIQILFMWLYNEFYLDHTVKHTKVEEIDYPTEFERQLNLQRTRIILPDNIANSFPSDTTHKTAPNDVIVDEIEDREQYKYEFSKKTAREILAAHDGLRTYYHTWAWRAGTVIVAHAVTLVLLLCLLCSSPSV